MNKSKFLFLFVGLPLLIFSQGAAAGWWLAADVVKSVVEGKITEKAKEIFSEDTEGEGAQTLTKGQSFKANHLIINLKNINDKGFVFVQGGTRSVRLVDYAEQNLGLSGSAEIDLKNYVEQGKLISGGYFVIFVLWNKEGQKIPLMDKTVLDGYGFDFSLIGDGTTLFHDRGKKSGGSGIVYWTAFYVKEDKKSGGFTISPANSAEVANFKSRFLEVNADPSIKAESKAANIAANIATILAANFTVCTMPPPEPEPTPFDELYSNQQQ